MSTASVTAHCLSLAPDAYEALRLSHADLGHFFDRVDEYCKNQSIHTKELTGSIEDLRAQQTSQSVVFEQQLNQAEQTQLLLQNELQDCRSKLSEALKDKESILLEKNMHQNGLSEFQRKVDALQTELQSFTQSNHQLEVDKRDLSSLIDKLQADVARLEEDNSQLSSRLQASRDTEDSLRDQLSDVKSKEFGIRFQCSQAEQELSLSRQQLEFYATELKVKSEELTMLRKEKSTVQLSLQSQLDVKTEEVSMLSKRLQQSSERYQELQTKFDDVSEKLRSSQVQLLEQEEQFKQEMTHQLRTSTVYQQQSEEAIRRLDSLNQSLDHAQREIEQLQETHADQLSDIQRQLSLSDATVRARDESITQLNEELSRINQWLSSHGWSASDIDVHDVSVLSPTASLARQWQKSGKSFTEIYASYIQLQHDFERERRETTRLNECLDQILREIQEKAPQFQQQRVDYERSLAMVATLSTRLDDAMQKHDLLLSKYVDADRQRERLEKQSATLLIDNEALTLQVRALLSKEDSAALANLPWVTADRVSSPEHMNSARDVIVAQLTSFSSVAELHQKHQELLRVVHVLSDEREKNEQLASSTQLAEENMRHKMSRAMDELNELREARSRQQDMIDDLVRQRDMYRTVLQNTTATATTTTTATGNSNDDKENKENESNTAASMLQMQVKDLEAQLVAFKTEKQVLDTTLQQQCDTLSTENADLRIQLGKSRAQLDYLNERTTSLSGLLEQAQRESTEYRLRVNDTVQQCLHAQTQLENAMHDVMAARETAEKAKLTLASVELERDMMRQNEQRLLRDYTALQHERQRQSDLMSSLQLLHNGLEKAERERQDRLTTRIDFLEKDLRQQQQQTLEQQQQSRELLRLKEMTLKELQEKYERTVSDYHTVKEALVSARTHADALQMRVDDLERLRLQQQSSLTVSSLSKTAEREPMHSTQDQEAILLREELQRATEHVAQFKAMSEASESALNALRESYDAYRVSMEHRIAELQHTVEKQHAESLQKSQSMAELETRLEALQSDCAQAQSRIVQLNEHVTTLQDAEKAIADKEASFKETLQQTTTQLQEAEQRFREEARQHTEDLQRISTMAEEISALKQRWQSADKERQLAEEKARLVAHTQEEERKETASQRDQLTRRLDDLQQENNQLLTQLETLAEQTEQRLQQLLRSCVSERNDSESAVLDTTQSGDRAEHDTGTDRVSLSSERTSFSTLDEWRSIVQFLRREKDLMMLQHETAQQEVRRLKQQMESLQRSLDEARALLQSERAQQAVHQETASQHAELLKKLSELHVLRESNERLAADNTQLRTECTAMKQNAQSTLEERQAWLEKQSQLMGELDALREGEQRWMAENAQWRQKLAAMVQQSGRVDPEAHAALEKEVTALRAQHAELQEQSEARIKKLKMHCSYWKTETEKTQADLQSKVQAIQSLETQLSGGGGQTASLQQQLTVLQEEKKVLSTELENTKEQLKKAIAALTKARTELKQAAGNAETQIKAQEQALREELEQEKQQGQLRLAAMKSQLEGKVKRLEASLQGLTASPQQHKTAQETPLLDNVAGSNTHKRPHEASSIETTTASETLSEGAPLKRARPEQQQEEPEQDQDELDENVEEEELEELDGEEQGELEDEHHQEEDDEDDLGASLMDEEEEEEEGALVQDDEEGHASLPTEEGDHNDMEEEPGHWEEEEEEEGEQEQEEDLMMEPVEEESHDSEQHHTEKDTTVVVATSQVVPLSESTAVTTTVTPSLSSDTRKAPSTIAVQKDTEEGELGAVEEPVTAPAASSTATVDKSAAFLAFLKGPKQQPPQQPPQQSTFVPPQRRVGGTQEGAAATRGLPAAAVRGGHSRGRGGSGAQRGGGHRPPQGTMPAVTNTGAISGGSPGMGRRGGMMMRGGRGHARGGGGKKRGV